MVWVAHNKVDDNKKWTKDLEDISSEWTIEIDGFFKDF